jgi:hypothetical protein
MGDFLVNGASVVTNGVGQLNLQAGENISISRDGRTLTISGEGGGQGLEYFEETQYALTGKQQGIINLYTDERYAFDDERSMIVDLRAQSGSARDKFEIYTQNSGKVWAGYIANIYIPSVTTSHYEDPLFVISKTQSDTSLKLVNRGDNEGAEWIYDATSGNANVPTTIVTNGLCKNSSFTYNNETYYITLCFTDYGWENKSGSILDIYPTYLTEEQRDTSKEYATMAALGIALLSMSSYSGYLYGGTAQHDEIALFAGATRQDGSDAKIKIYNNGKVEGIKSGGKTYEAGENIQINDGVISATDTTYNDFEGATSSADGEAGLVPQPLITDRFGFLQGNGTWANIFTSNNSAEDVTSKITVSSGVTLRYGRYYAFKIDNIIIFCAPSLGLPFSFSAGTFYDVFDIDASIAPVGRVDGLAWGVNNSVRNYIIDQETKKIRLSTGNFAGFTAVWICSTASMSQGIIEYSTEEKVIGTWMGDTLYQKCVATGGSVPSGATLIERTAMASTGYDTIKYIKS